MATSGSYNASTIQYGCYMFVNWQLASQNVAGNYSTINWQAYFHFQGADSQLDNGVVNTNVGNVWSNGGRVYNFANNFTTRNLGLASGSFNVGHDGAGNGAVQFGIGITSQFSPARSEGTSGVWGLPTIPRDATITGAPDFTDEDDPYLSYSNPAGGSNNMYNAWLEPNPISTHLALRNIGTPTSGTMYWGLTTTERNQLRAAIPNANSCTMRMGFYNSITGNASYVDRTFYIINANPTFTTFTYRDSNAATVAITGDDQYLIQGYSTLEMAILAANKAAALKSATMVKYNSAISSISTDTTYTTSDIAQALGVLNVAADTALVVKAIDSRGNNTSVSKTVKVLPYVAPLVVATARRTNNFETATNFHIEGNISRLTIASVDKNAVNTSTGVAYRYKKTTDVTWGSWTNKTSATSGASISVTDFAVNLDRNYSWNVEVRITDKLTTSTLALVVPIGTPIMRVSTYDNLVYNNEQPLMPSHIGMVITTTALTTAAAVQAIYGGTWAAWGVGRSPVGVDTGQTEFNTVEKTGGAKTHTLAMSEIPSHGISMSHHGDETGSVIRSFGGINGTSNGAISYPGSYKAPPGSTSGAGSIQSPNAYWGGGGAHNNLAPYITAYMWKRTA